MVCVLIIMQNEWSEPILTRTEINAFLLMSLRLNSWSNDKIKDVKRDFVPTPRAVHLATLFCANRLAMFSECVGDVTARKYFISSRTFDGKLFHKIYKGLQEKEEYEVVERHEREEMTILCDYITDKGKNVAV